MRPLYFVVGHPFGLATNPEDIFEGPFSTEEIATNALETHLLNNGEAARVACLTEAVKKPHHLATRHAVSASLKRQRAKALAEFESAF